MFELTDIELFELVANCDRLSIIKHSGSGSGKINIIFTGVPYKPILTCYPTLSSPNITFLYLV